MGGQKKSLVFLDEERSREVIANEDHGMMIMLANADENGKRGNPSGIIFRSLPASQIPRRSASR